MSEATTADSANNGAGVLARKVAAAREGTTGLSSSVTLKALRRSLARAAADLCELPLAVIAARQVNRCPEDLGRHLSDDKLLVVLDGPKGRIGAVAMDAAAVTALIQQQTMGQVMGKTPTERHYTATDAAMTADFINRAFVKISSMLDGQADQNLFEDFCFGARIDDVRSLLLGLEADDYRVIELTLDLSCGAMQGSLTLILPEPSSEDLAEAGHDTGLNFTPSLGSNMGAMRVEMSAVLCKLRVPANVFTNLQVGALLPLEQAFLYETELVAINGQIIANGNLGQINGARAVRMNETRTKLVGDSVTDDRSFSADVGPGMSVGLLSEPPAIDLEIAAQSLQDPIDSPGDLLMGDLPMGDLPMGDLPMGDLPMGDLGGLAADGLPPLGGMGDDLPALLGSGPMGEFNPDEAMAEISELAGLGDELT